MTTTWMTPMTPAVLAVLAACGGGGAPGAGGSKMDRMMSEGMAMQPDPDSAFGPLTVGADWMTYAKVNKASFPSETHGGRLVDVYVNPTGQAAYQQDDAELPVGTVIVKTSKQADGGAGPLFVMEKRAAGYAPDHGDWYYAIHWAEPDATWAKKLGGPVYWRTPSPRAAYCSDCHDGYDRGVGGVPAEQRAW
ncbi:MAG: hypothetical protein KA190_19360 [Kofleriaceae bacterium]|nr:hypothetical protein [Kofleriaceae bacterium]